MLTARSTDINQFLQRKQPGWRHLEAVLQKIEATGLRSLSPSEIREFGVLYRRASSDLVSARAKTANAEVLEYLNDLVARGYGHVYRTRRLRVRDLLTFIVADFPRLLRHFRGYVIVSTSISLGAAVFGFAAQRRDPAAAYYLLPPALARILPVARQRLAQEPGHMVGPNEMLQQSSMILTHNIGVAFMAFAAGILFGVGTLMALAVNGFMLGIFTAALAREETAVAFWSLILPHGVIELPAIFIAGGAGLMIGSALLSPGRRSWRDSLVEKGRYAVLLVLGTVPLFVCAGLIEGFITPPIWIPPALKLAFAGVAFVGLLLYIGLAGRRGGSAPVAELSEAT